MRYRAISSALRTRSLRGSVVTALALIMTMGIGGCDTEDLVQLSDPDLVTLPVVEDTANIEVLRNGALLEFGQALTGPAAANETPGIVGISALFSDEAWYASTFEGMKNIDERRVFETNEHVEDVYRWLHRARNLLSETADRYAQNRPEAPDQTLLRALEGYTYLYLAEGWCSGVPFSRAPLGEPVEFAAGLTTTETLGEAIAIFDEALALGGNDTYANLARVGKARALQNLGDMTQAAAVAAQVSPGFQFTVTYSDNASAQNNGVWYNFNSSRRTSVASNEGINGITYFTLGQGNNTLDPRVPVQFSGTGLGTQLPHYNQLEYSGRGSDVVLASKTEALLIEAEAALDGGNSAGYLPALNALRAGVGLGSLTDPGGADERILQLYEERAFWLWLTGHRMGDLRRLVREYGFTQTEVFPRGTTIFNTLYSDDVNFPIPDEERNNPLFEGCVDRGA